MRKAFSIAGAFLLAASTMASPVQAQAGSASGDCSALDGVEESPDDAFSPAPTNAANSTRGFSATVTYSGVPAPTALGVIARYNDELEVQIGLASTVANASSGTFTFPIQSSISPDAQGGGQNFLGQGNRGTNAFSNKPSRSGRGNGIRAGGSTSTSSVNGQYVGSAGGLGPGAYVMYIYTGEIKDMPETVKDGPSGRRFFADEKGFLGKFTCTVEDDK